MTDAAGLGRPDPEYGTLWAVAAAFADYDRDGWLDLFVSNYCVWDPKTEPACGDDEGNEYCHPDRYAGLPNSLFRNNRDGTFTDVSVATGIRGHVGKGMGIGVADFDRDGWVDFFLANDTLPAFLFMNQRGATFKETSFAAGVAFTQSGRPISGHGRRRPRRGRRRLPGHLPDRPRLEDFPLFRNLGDGTFEEVTRRSGVSALARARAGWSNGIYDLNNDGRKDLFVACASGVMDPNGRFRGRSSCPTPSSSSSPDGRFVDGSPAAGPDFRRAGGAPGCGVRGPRQRRPGRRGRHRPRGARRDLAERLARPSTTGCWSGPSARKSNRDGQGTRIKVVTASRTQYNHVNTAVGYGGSSDLRAHFGLGADTVVKELTLTWPSGAVQTLATWPPTRS